VVGIDAVRGTPDRTTQRRVQAVRGLRVVAAFQTILSFGGGSCGMRRGLSLRSDAIGCDARRRTKEFPGVLTTPDQVPLRGCAAT
jgi:hypothetical protein